MLSLFGLLTTLLAWGSNGMPCKEGYCSCAAGYAKDVAAYEANNQTEIVCYTYNWGTTGRGVAASKCYYPGMGSTKCSSGKCYRKERYKMQRKYEVKAGCCTAGEECVGKVC